MKLRGVVATAAITSLVFASTAVAATAPPMVGKIACVASGVNPRITATVPATLSSPRVFFRANNERTEYYVDMHRTSARSNDWYAILPMPEPATKTITYRVAGVDDNKQWVVSAPITVNATKSCAVALTGEEQSMANGIVLGLTTAGQSEVPAGFSCRGIVKVLGVDCQLRDAEGCRRLLAQQAKPPVKGVVPAAVAGATGTGLSSGLLAALAAAGLAAGLLIFNSGSSGSNGPTTSTSRP